MNIFVLIESNPSLRRVSIAGTIQGEITCFLSEQKEAFIANKTPVNFCSSYKLDDDEIFVIEEYPIPQYFTQAVNNPLSVEPLIFSPQMAKIKALFGKFSNSNSMVFQMMDSRRLLSKKFTLIHSGDTYTRLQNEGLILQDKLSAVFENNSLYFYSYHIVKRFLDLSSYYREASNAQLDTFIGDNIFNVENSELFKQNSDSILRKKIASLLGSGFMELPVKTIIDKCNRHGVNINVVNDKIVLPDNRKELKDLISFFSNDIYTGPMDDENYISNSKRKK